MLILEPGELSGRQLELIGMAHQIEYEVPLQQGVEHSGVGDRSHVGTHRSHPTEPCCRHLLIEELDGLSHRVGRRETADDGIGSPRDPRR